MDHGKSSRRGGATDFGKPASRNGPQLARLIEIEIDSMPVPRRQRGQKLERQAEVAHEIAEFLPPGAVPGDDGIEGAETSEDVFGRQQSEPVKSRCNNGLRAIGESGKGNILARAPDLGILAAQRFERGQAHDKIADSTGTNQKTSQMNHQL
jgi:hypothetical protein